MQPYVPYVCHVMSFGGILSVSLALKHSHNQLPSVIGLDEFVNSGKLPSGVPLELISACFDDMHENRK